MAGYVSGVGGANAGPRVVAVCQPEGRRRKNDDGDQPRYRAGGRRRAVLVLDLDSQGNASTGLGIDSKRASRPRSTF